MANSIAGRSGSFRPQISCAKELALTRDWRNVCIALLLGAGWFYQNRAPKPVPVLSSPSQPSETKAEPKKAEALVQAEPKKAEALVPELVPFIPDRGREVIRKIYLPADDHKALAISMLRMGFITGQADDDTAKAAALDNCRQATMPRATKIYDAIFMRSAIPWCTLAAIHRPRRSLGLFLIHRWNDRSTPCTYR